MKVSEIKKHLETAASVNFQFPNGTFAPEHFHVTEVGIVTKNLIDCRGTVRNEKVANFQLWDANDYDHRLKAAKLQNIIVLSEKILGMENLEIEVEYQSETIGKYDLEFDGQNFILIPKHTNCLAKENCGVLEKKSISYDVETANCSPGGGCC